MDEHGLTRALGWVSVGVGLAPLAAPIPVMNVFGIGERPNIGRFLGARDIVLGAGLLRGEDKAAWARARAPSPTPSTRRSSSAARPPGPSGGTGRP
jgi:hypothetical protein